MNLYMVSRTDEVDWNECSSALVRAPNETDALSLVLRSGFTPGEPLEGFNSDGSNAEVSLVSITGPSEIVMISESGA